MEPHVYHFDTRRAGMPERSEGSDTRLGAGMPERSEGSGTRLGAGMRLRSGMVFTIEPMVNLGAADVCILADGWTVVTADGSLSAQFEHTVLVTTRGCEILTR
jgi:methionine aminopeptidase